MSRSSSTGSPGTRAWSSWLRSVTSCCPPRWAGHRDEAVAGRRALWGSLGSGPLLVAAAVAGPQVELCPVCRVRVGVVEAFTGGRVDQLPVLHLPLLVGATPAGVELDGSAVVVVGAGDVYAAAGAVDRDAAVAVERPVLRGGVAVAGPHLDLVAVGGAAVVVVHADRFVVAGHDRPGATAAAAGGGGVASGDDVRLDGGLGRGRGVAGGHDALVEGSVRALAVVAAGAEDDGTLLLHRVVARGPHPAEVRRQGAGLGVAAEDGPLVGAALDHGGGEPVAGGRVVGVVAGAGARVQAVLHVGHDPRAVAGAVAPDLDIAEVDGLHGPGAIVVVVGLGVAVVEAAAAVVVRAVEDRVLALRVIPGGDVPV